MNLFEGKINNLVYFQNNKPLVEFESIDFKGNLKQGYAAINSVTKIELSKNIYRDIKLEFSSTGDTDYVKEITLSFKSTISDLIPLAPKAKYDLTWINSLVRSQEEKEVEITLSKAIAFDNIENFFTPEENIFELKVKNLLIPLSNRNSINLGILNVKGEGIRFFLKDRWQVTTKKSVVPSIIGSSMPRVDLKLTILLFFLITSILRRFFQIFQLLIYLVR